MAGRTVVVSATNLLARGFLVVPTDRKSTDGVPVNGLFAVARAIHRVLALKLPTRALAVIEANPRDATWPAILKAQLPMLPELFTTLGFHVVTAPEEEDLVAGYTAAAHEEGDDVVIVGVDKRYAQLVSERVWWYDANKDVRYTTEIVKKRFNVGPEHVGEWLALVGDDSGNEVLPGIKGIGAKGATGLIEEHGSVAGLLSKLDTVEGRLAKPLKAAKAEIPVELSRAAFQAAAPLPTSLREMAYVAPNPRRLNALYERLGFVELLVPEVAELRVEVCESAGEATAALSRMASPVALHILLEDAAPVRQPIAGLAFADGKGQSFYVPKSSAAWPELVPWLESADAPKIGHDLVEASAELRRAGITLRGIVGDSGVASHLTESSNWAPHDLTIVAKLVLVARSPRTMRFAGRASSARHGVVSPPAVWQSMPVDWPTPPPPSGTSSRRH